MNTCFVALTVVGVVCATPYSGLLSHGSGSQVRGNAAGNVARGSSTGPYQGSQITQVSSKAGGSVIGRGVSQNRASASDRSINGFRGPQHTSNTNAISNQRTFDNQGHQGFNPAFGRGFNSGFNQGFQGRGFNSFNRAPVRQPFGGFGFNRYQY